MFWPYKTPGISDDLFESLPGIPFTKREIRLLLIAALKMKSDSVLWDIGAGSGTIPIEIGLLCPNSTIIALERDEEVASLINKNCENFGVTNVQIVTGNAPESLQNLSPLPDRICIEGGQQIKKIIQEAWDYLQPEGKLIATAGNLTTLYAISESLAQLQARNIEVVQSGVNRIETRGIHQILAAVDPIFILSGEKL
jgi:cobalt-precorrin-6B (C15)-methyltransferase